MCTRKITSPLLVFVLVLTVAFPMILFGSVPVAYAQDGTPPTPEPEIVGGGPATPGEWPWQVALVNGSASGPNYWYDQFCGGSLIHPQWVVTAAHCITDQYGNVEAPSSVDIVAGIYNLSSPAAGYQQRDVIQIVRHPGYNPNIFDNDIAMLKLSSPVTIGGSGESKTALVQAAPASLGTLAGGTATVTGWGKTQSVPQYPDQLYEVAMPVLANSTCGDANHWGGGITDNMLCAGYDGGGYSSCFGDSGGPLVVNSGGQWYLAGIVSFGTNPCALPYIPAVFTRVSQYGSWINQTIGPATLVSPSGSLGSNYTPTYTWNAVNTMTSYQLWVNGPNGHYFDKWYTAAEAGCASGTGTCSITPTKALWGGNYTWWIKTWNPAGAGAWSAGMNISTTIIPAPGIPTLVSPNTNIGTNYNPTYTWNQVANATSYYLWVNGPSGNLIQKWYTSAEANCDGSTCFITPTTTLGGGNHMWWVQAWNPTGTGPWSSAMSFSTATPTIPPAATLVSPNTNLGSNYNPTYTWNQVTGSAWYYLWVKGPNGVAIRQWYTSAQANCNGSTCSVTPTTSLGGGNHTWWIQTWNAAGTGPWSAAMDFSTAIPTRPAAATLLSPSGTTANHTPTYTWNQVSDATWYYLWVNGPNGNVLKQWYTSAQANCDGSTCFVTPSTALASGAHTWWIQTWNSAGTGPWSSPMSFTVSP